MVCIANKINKQAIGNVKLPLVTDVQEKYSEFSQLDHKFLFFKIEMFLCLRDSELTWKNK